MDIIILYKTYIFILTFASIQPFADIVRNNTCCDGAKKSKKILQHTHLLSRGQLADQIMISERRPLVL